MVYSLNHTHQVRLGQSPADIIDENSASLAWYSQYKSMIGQTPAQPKLKVGQLVRLSKEKFLWEKPFLTGWTKEVFTIKSIRKTLPVVTYYLVDQAGEDISGAFYDEELTPVNSTENKDT